MYENIFELILKSTDRVKKFNPSRNILLCVAQHIPIGKKMSLRLSG